MVSFFASLGGLTVSLIPGGTGNSDYVNVVGLSSTAGTLEIVVPGSKKRSVEVWSCTYFVKSDGFLDLLSLPVHYGGGATSVSVLPTKLWYEFSV